MLGFKNFAHPAVTLSGRELAQQIRKVQFDTSRLGVALSAAHRLRLCDSEASVLCNIGLAHEDLGEMEEAAECLNGRWPWPANREACAAKPAHSRKGEHLQAIELCRQALDIYHEVRDRRGQSKALDMLSDAYLALGEGPGAVEALERRREIARELNDRKAEGDT